MSGVMKGVKKAFKKVGKVVKKVAPYALAAGAVVFTAGSALGLPAMAGGWGGAVAKGLGAVGISGSSGIAGALTGAITQAGYGAAVGGIGSLASGGDFADGATAGALAGGLSGGVMGGIGMPTDPLAGTGQPVGGDPMISAGKSVPIGSPPVPSQPAQTGFMTQPTGYQAAASVPGVSAPFAPSVAPAASAMAPVSAAPTGATGFMSNIANSPLTGHVIKGLGTALMSSSEPDPYEARERERRDIAGSYDLPEGTGGLLPAATPGGLSQPGELYMTGRRSALAQAERNAPRDAPRKAAYQFDPATGTIIFA